MMYEIFKDIPEYNNWKEITFIDKGWSFDEKYYVKDKLNKEYILRVSDIKKYNQKQSEFITVQNIYQTDINMSKPLSFGICNKGTQCYSILSYIPGEQVELVLPLLDDFEQYEMGIKAGKYLKKIHSSNVRFNDVNWESKYIEKINNRIKVYKECGITNKKVDEMIKYLNNNLDLLKNRLVCQHHGDFHVGNLIVDNSLKLSVIDFNRVKIGDPYYEFNRIPISSKISKAFASGQIDGYFNNNVPDEFFKYLKFYVISVLIGTIPWSLQFSKKDLEYALETINNVYSEYNGLESVIPNWYVNIG